LVWYNTLYLEQENIRNSGVKNETYTADEIAKYLRVHPYTVKRLARAGEIPGFKVGDQWRFDAAEIELWKKTKVKASIKRRKNK